MLYDFQPRLTEFDLKVYDRVVPPHHLLCQALEVINWDEFYDRLAPFYSNNHGRHAKSPVLMLKLEFLRYKYSLSDREVIRCAETDMAFRWFLQLPVRGWLPDPSTLCVFRGRLGVKGFREVFDQVVREAREHGLVKDRLRIKDATHVIANIAVPSTLVLVAQMRDKLLAAAEPFVPLLVEGERVNLDLLREASKDLTPAERLSTRVAQLKEMLYWVDEVPAPEDAETNSAWQTFLSRRKLAHKILDDQEHPDAGDRTLSTTDSDARRCKHGEWYEGYLLDMLVDPDSEIITNLNVLPAGGDEAVDAVTLICQEEETHGNDIQALSMDGAGFNGPVLRELEDPNGLNIDTYVPPPTPSKRGLFTPQDFEEDAERKTLTCPAGKTSHKGYYEQQKQTTKYRFPVAGCRACPLLHLCMTKPPRRHGRTVGKTDYQVEHDRVRQKATTPQYAEVRREHPLVERKLGEVMNRHSGRRARYWGLSKVFMQEAMACTATNVMRLVRLLRAPTKEVSCQT